MTSQWFPGEGRNADDEAFLAELRSLASVRGLADVRPEDTGTSIYAEQWVVARARVPRLPAGADVELQVGSGAGHPVVPPLVACWETHGFLLDQWEEVKGNESTSTELADRAFRWMSEQLERPVSRRDWPRVFLESPGCGDVEIRLTAVST